MIPLLAAREVRDTLLDYLRSTWQLADKSLERELLSFLSGPTGTFKGPWVRIALPFAQAPEDAPVPLDIRPSYRPYLHQLLAWQRLSSKDGHEPEATLVTTGTGSGKTECFLYPILDHVYRAISRGEKGIKAIILYPMNALAADQARRMAAVVHGDHRLRGRLRIGMFVGGSGRNRDMGPGHVIDDNDLLRRQPPDILLTNYRMLDLLLQRPRDAGLWAQNAPGRLRYLVLDELHTYDGAQGTDVACLVRRLAARLGGADAICPVGTSATVGGGETSGELIEFAKRIFDHPFLEDALVGESRIAAEELFAQFAPGSGPPGAPENVRGGQSDVRGGLPPVLGGQSDVLGDPLGVLGGRSDVLGGLPPVLGGASLDPEPQEEAEVHVRKVARAWFPEDPALAATEGEAFRVRLGEAVMRHPTARALVRTASRGLLPWEAVAAEVRASDPALGARPAEEAESLLRSLLTLLSWAKRQVGPGPRRMPLVSVQVQLWVREARRLLREVSEARRFRWLDDGPSPDGTAALPMIYCHDCGHAGWVTVKSGLGDRVSFDYPEIARAVEQRDPEVMVLHQDASVRGEDGTAPPRFALDPKTGELGPEREIGPGKIAIFAQTDAASAKGRGRQRCPACGENDAMRMLASRSASLTSVAVGHLFTTPLNTDRKLLAFSDSVQDASHRAGFFGGRTFRFSLRSAMLAVVPPEGISLAQIGPAMRAAWPARLAAGKWDPEGAFVGALLPSDLEYLDAYGDWEIAIADHQAKKREAETRGEEYAEPLPPPPAALVTAVTERLRWEATRELGVATRIGRTLEQSGCLAVTVDEARFSRAVDRTVTVLPSMLGVLHGVGKPAFAALIAGLVTRVRLRGGVVDPMLEKYIASSGSGYMLSKAESPLLSPFGRFTSRPIFLTSEPKPRRFDSVQPADRKNWVTDWMGRALGIDLGLAEARDVAMALMPILEEAGIFAARAVGAKHRVWGIDPEALLVRRDHAWRRCATCGFEVTAVPGSPTDPIGAACLRYRCEGRFEEAPEDTNRTATYYRRYYERGALGRVWPREHTGLLPREEREDLEIEFKERPRPNSPNLLSCTPTLEMGIDIGDLSATLLCSVPPGPASYVQRVGRAGRETGNALILSFAASRPHDLYYFEDPLALMAGTIHPPGCYLDAPEVLKRQALAFCFDRLAREGHKMPGRLREALSDGDEWDVRLPNLRAALRLGLRLHFGGDPDFLMVDSYDEPLPGGEGRRRYVVVLDLVPGGTGMLVDLVQDKGKKLQQVLLRAKDALRRCPCNARGDEVHACHLCLYAYAELSRRDERPPIEVLDREKAIAEIDALLAGFAGLTQADSVGTLSQKHVLESELERRLVARIEAWAKDQKDTSWERLDVDRWRLSVGARRWLVRAQVDVDETQAEHACRPDLVFYPEGQDASVLPVAVFADGAAFHVQPGKTRSRIEDDLKKRLGLVRPGRFLTWSITWRDLNEHDSGAIGDGVPSWWPDAQTLSRVKLLASKLGMDTLTAVLDRDPLAGLFAHLREPTKLRELAAVSAAILLHSRGQQVTAAEAARRHHLARTLERADLSRVDPTQGADTVLAMTVMGAENEARLLVSAPREALGALGKHPDKATVTLRLEDGADQRRRPQFQTAWRQMLRAWNLLQALPGTVVTSLEQLGETVAPVVQLYPVRPPVADVLLAAEATARPPGMLSEEVEEQLAEIGDDRARAAVRAVIRKGAAVPAIPYELRVPKRGAIGDVEIGWSSNKVGAYLDHQRETAEKLRAEGWTMFAIERGLDAGELARALGVEGGEA